VPTSTDALVAAISKARNNDTRTACPAVFEDAAQAYAVQARVAAEVGRVAGFKTARKPGQPQIVAPIFEKDLHASGARVESQFGGPLGIELEVGLLIDAPLPAFDAPDFAALAAVRVSPIAVIEIVDTRLEGAGSDAPLVKLADNQINAGLVTGALVADWSGGPLRRVTARMQAGETCLVDGPVDVPGGCAFETLAALAGMIGEHCGGLQPGQIVITGSLHPLTYVLPGTPVVGHIEGLGDVNVQIG
jgi:2-keto-4-pentenoate hydratase